MPSILTGGYAPPGVYTQTLFGTAAPIPSVPPLVPMFIGTGSEILVQTNLPVVRGSSSSVDQQIVNEDEAGRAVVSVAPSGAITLGAFDGSVNRFQVKNFPMVSGDGTGTTTTDTSSISVTINGEPVVVLGMTGATGVVEISEYPVAGDVVLCTYYFDRTDTLVTDTVSAQVTSTAAIINGRVGESFTFATGTNQFVLSVDGLAAVTVTLPSSTVTAAVVAATINGTAGIGSLVASSFVNNLGQTCIRLTSNISISIGDGNANGVLGFVANDATARNRTFYTFNGPIVNGNGGGVTTTNPADVVVLVNGIAVTPTAVNGRTRAVTLPYAPKLGSTVTIQYYFNTWQDTFDYLANTGVTAITQATLAAGSGNGASAFIQGVDYILKNDTIVWGTAVLVNSGLHTEGSATFGNTQITASLVDNQAYMASCSRVVTTSGNVSVESKTQFQLPYQPTTGNGRNSPLGSVSFNLISNGRSDLPTDQPGLVTAYWGFGVQDAMNRGAVTVTKVDSDTSTITLASEVPEGATVYATFYYNTLTDQAFIGSSRGFTVFCVSSGTAGVGTYSITDGLNLPVYGVTFLGKGAALNSIQVEFPSGSEFLSDARLENGAPILETVTVQFATSDATPARFTFPGASPYNTIPGQSSALRVTINGAPGGTGGAGGINLTAPTEGSRGGAFASLLSDGISYDAASGETTYDITAGVNDVVSLLVDGVSLTATAAAGAGSTVADFVTAINAAAVVGGTANPYYTSAGSFPQGFTVVASNSDRLSFNYTGSVNPSSGTQTITLTPGVYTAATLVPEINTQLSAINGLGGLNAVVTCTATGSSGLQFSLQTSLAKSTFTLAAGNAAPTELVVVGGVTYTFVAALALPNDVLIGGTAAATLANLVAAITAGAGAGTVYGTGTVVNPVVTAVSALTGPPATMIATAILPGIAANTSPTTTTAVFGSWTGGTLSGGDASGYLEFITDGTPARDFAIVAGIDTAAHNGNQSKLYSGPIATRYTVATTGGRLPYDRVTLRNRIFPGAGSIAPYHALSQTSLASQGGTGAALSGLTVGLSGEAAYTGCALGPQILGDTGWSSQVASGQPAVTFYDGSDPSYAANNVFNITVNGTLITATFGGSGTGTVTAIGPASLGGSVLDTLNTALAAAPGTVIAKQEGASIRIYGTGVDSLSQSAAFIVGNGSANTVLGFTAGTVATVNSITAKQFASALMSHNATANFVTWMTTLAPSATYFPGKALASTITSLTGEEYVYLQSRTLGVSSSFLFGTATAADALRLGSGLGMVSGDGSSGEATVNGFFVTSSDPANGSGSANTSVFNLGAGQDGVVGQTYVDDVTGLTFTVLPRAGGLSYPTGATSTLTFRCSNIFVTDSNIPTLAIPGLELTVSNTADVPAGDTALVETFKRGGSEPTIGQIYYVSYNYRKTDFSAKLFARLSDVVNEYGAVSPDNPLSLAAYFAFLNGSSVIATLQVPKTSGTNSASEAAYIAAIDRSSGASLPGFNSPSVLVLLTPATQTLARYMTIHCDVQSSIRYKAERTSIFGFASGTRSDQALAIARTAGSTRVRFVYPDIASVSLTDVLGNTKTYLVDGRYLAVAAAAATTSATIDPATPWESRQLYGFVSLNRRLDAVTANQIAVGGITVLENRPPFIKIRHGLTSDVSNVLTKTPTVIQIADEIQKRVRATIDPFIGAKFLPQIIGQIEGRLSEMFKNAVQEQLITTFTGISVETDPTDPTAIIVNAFWQPVYPLLYVQCTLRVSAQ